MGMTRKEKNKVKHWVYHKNAQPQPSKTIGYCQHHNWYMTVKSTKYKQCLEKNCSHYRKNNDHPYWYNKYCDEIQKIRKQMAKKEGLNNGSTNMDRAYCKEGSTFESGN